MVTSKSFLWSFLMSVACSPIVRFSSSAALSAVERFSSSSFTLRSLLERLREKFGTKER